jgi:D-glycero-D-manno-heptose 1,7-bisphosphate phosphatase
MLLDAARDLPIDLTASVMIGDAVSDVLAARAAGARPLLVRTGLGETQLAELARARLNDVLVVRDLAEAVDALF